MIKFLRRNAEIGCPRGRFVATLLAFVIVLWTAGAMALSPPAGTPINNQAAAQYGDANGNPLSAVSNTVSAILSGAPRLKVTAVANPNPVSPGGILTYTLTIENTGNLSATAVTANGVLSANLQFLSASNGGISSPPNVNWNLGDILSGGSVTLTLTATPVAGTPSGTVLPFSISAFSTNGTSDSTSLNTTVGAAPNLVITDIADVISTTPGGVIEYTIHYGNVGNVAATNVLLRNELPSETALVAGSITGGGTITDRTITWTLGTLLPGASGTVKFRVTVSPIAANGAIIRNISVISSTETGVTSSNELMIPVVVSAMAPPTAAKGFSPGSILPGGASTMTITLTNANATDITGAAFTDAYPSGMTNTAAMPVSNTCGGTVTMAGGGSSLSLAGGVIPASGSCSIVVTVTVTATVAGPYTNSTGAISTTNAGSGTAASGTLTVVASPTATKAFNPGVIPVSGTSIMTITLYNTNPTTATGVAFTDAYPSGMTNTVATTTSNTCGGTVTMASSGSSLSLADGVIPASGSCSIVLPVTATVAGTYTNSTGTISTANAGTLAAASATLTVMAQLTAAKSFSPNSIPINGASNMTITLTNPNATAATGVAFTDTYPAGMTNTVATPTTNTCGGTVTMANGGSSLSLADGVIPASGSCSIVLPVKATVAGTLTNNTGAIATANAGAIAAATATISVGAPINASLQFTKSAPSGKVAPGAQVVYTFTVTNDGPVAATGIIIEDPLPAGTTFVSADVPSTVTTGTVRLTVGVINPGAGRTVHLTVAINAADTAGKNITNTASVTAVEAQTKTASATISVGTPSLSIIKTATTAVTRPGNVLAYAIELKNDGDVPVSGITLRDTLPSGVTFLNADLGGTLQGGTVSWSILALDPSKTLTVHLNVTIDKTFSGTSISNTVIVSGGAVTEKSSTVSKDVTPRTPGEVAFFSSDWQPAYGYMSGDVIYIQVKDADQNLDPAVAETVTIVLTNLATLDTKNVVLTETGTNTGIFRGSIPCALQPKEGSLTVAYDSSIQATYTDILDDAPVHFASALIDPAGIVFNSINGNPIPGAVVTLRNWNAITDSCDLTSSPALPPGQFNPAAPTGTDGKFAFPLVPAGDYCFEVAPPTGYTYPSVVADSDLPAGFTIGNGSKGGKFTLSVGDPPLINDIPVDPPPSRLSITKTANKTTASIGEMIIYTLKLANNGDAPVTAVTISDILPHGITYITGSSQMEENSFADPQTPGNRSLAWKVANLASNASLTISYRAVVGPDTQMGDRTNTAFASGTSIGKATVSNRASVKVKITEGVFTGKGTIVGRVFIDRDGDGLAKKETGVPDVALYLEDGTRVITDKSGKFSISGVVAGTHVLRLDETSLPRGLTPKPLSNRFMNSGTSQFVDMTAGGLFKANFAFDKKYAEPSDKPEATPESKPPLKESTEQTPAVTLQPDTTVKETSGKASPPIYAPPAEDAKGEAVVSTTPAQDQEIIREEETATAEQPQIITTTPADGTANQKSGSTDEKITPEPLTKEVSKLPLEEKIKNMTPDLEFLSPADQTLSGKTSIRVIVKASTNSVLTLTVNGKPVDETHIGKKITYEKGGVVIYEFVDVRLNAGEENIIAAELKDQFNITRGKKQIQVAAIGEMARIVLVPDRNKAEANGQAKIDVKVSLEDKKGHVVPYDNAITVDVTAGEILEKDSDPANEGHQVMCKDGTAHFTVVAPRETGEAKIIVQANNMTKSADIYFIPHLRPMFIVGVGEIVLGHGKSSGDLGYLKDRSFYGDGTYVDGRGAFFMKGNIYNDILLTTAYDSKKKRSDELFRESDTRVDSEEKYPIYGDESKTGYEALSRESLYVKLEKGKSSLLYGDYRTELTETRLSAYNRSLNGLKLEVNTDKFKLRSFGAHTDQTQLVDTLPGKGISGLYYLTSSNIIDGSDRVVIETRDRIQPDRVLNKDLKSRGVDYDIDYGLGTILFGVAVPSHDADGNPLYIVVTYESSQNGNKYYVYGGRGAYKIAKWLEVGATGIVEQNDISDKHIFGGDMKLNLPGSTTLKAEYAQTRGLFEISSFFTPQDGEGWSLDIESKPLKALSLKGYYRNLSDYFSNDSANDAVRGTNKYGLEAAYEVQPTFTLNAKYLDEEDRINKSSRLLASVGATKKFTKTKLSAELSHEESDNLTDTPAQTPSTPAGLLNGVPFFNAYETPERATFFKLALERELLKDLSLSVSHKQDVGGNGYFISQGGLNYKLNKQNRLYVREEYAKYEDGTQNRTLLGVESQVIKNTTVFSEYRLADGAAGSRNQQVMGLKNKWQVREGVTANIAGEYLSTISGQKNENEPDAYAVAAGMEYLPKDNFKITGRLEHRNEIDGEKSSYLAEIATAYKLHPDYSLLLSERYFLEKNGADDNHTSRLIAGLAYRPLDNDRFNALSKIEYKYNRQPASTPAYTTNAFIISTEGIYQFNRDLQLMGKYAGKLEKEDSYSSYTDLISAQFIYDLSERFDIGAEYRLLTSHLTNTSLHGGSLEFGYRLIDQLWLSLGYSFDRFDADLAGDSYQGEGPFLRLRFKFDENSLKSIRK